LASSTSGGGGTSVEIQSVTDTATFASHQSNLVSASQNCGTANTPREIWVCVPTLSGGGNYAGINTLTIGGNTPTKIFEDFGQGYFAATGISFWRYIDSTGSLGSPLTVQATFSGSIQFHTGFITFVADIGSSLLDSYGDHTRNSVPTNTSISTSETGWSFYCALINNSTTATAPNFGNSASFDIGTDEWVTYGFNSPEDAGTVSIEAPAGSPASGSHSISGISVEAI
jgi:hypothetical protein